MIVCPKCGLKFRMKKMGVMCQELLENGTHYRFFSGDLWYCPNPKCDREVISGFGNPIYDYEYKYNVDYQFI
jgi:hypothetical protein